MSVKPSNISILGSTPKGIIQKPPTQGSESQRRKANFESHKRGTAGFK